MAERGFVLNGWFNDYWRFHILASLVPEGSVTPFAIFGHREYSDFLVPFERVPNVVFDSPPRRYGNEQQS
jgi:hypothetical protein